MTSSSKDPSNLVLSILSCLVLSYFISSYLILTHFILSNLILPYLILPHLIVFYLILTQPNTLTHLIFFTICSLIVSYHLFTHYTLPLSFIHPSTYFPLSSLSLFFTSFLYLFSLPLFLSVQMSSSALLKCVLENIWTSRDWVCR